MRMIGVRFIQLTPSLPYIILINKYFFSAELRNRDGYLTKAELRKTSRKMTDTQIDAVFEKFDKNRDGRLDFEEFKELMESHKKSAPK